MLNPRLWCFFDTQKYPETSTAKRRAAPFFFRAANTWHFCTKLNRCPCTCIVSSPLNYLRLRRNLHPGMRHEDNVCFVRQCAYFLPFFACFKSSGKCAKASGLTWQKHAKTPQNTLRRSGSFKDTGAPLWLAVGSLDAPAAQMPWHNQSLKSLKLTFPAESRPKLMLSDTGGKCFTPLAHGSQHEVSVFAQCLTAANPKLKGRRSLSLSLPLSCKSALETNLSCCLLSSQVFYAKTRKRYLFVRSNHSAPRQPEEELLDCDEQQPAKMIDLAKIPQSVICDFTIFCLVVAPNAWWKRKHVNPARLVSALFRLAVLMFPSQPWILKSPHTVLTCVHCIYARV